MFFVHYIVSPASPKQNLIPAHDEVNHLFWNFLFLFVLFFFFILKIAFRESKTATGSRICTHKHYYLLGCCQPPEKSSLLIFFTSAFLENSFNKTHFYIFLSSLHIFIIIFLFSSKTSATYIRTPQSQTKVFKLCFCIQIACFH